MQKGKISMKPFTNSELAAFCGQLALILRSGISSMEGLSLMHEDLPEGDTRVLLGDILHKMGDRHSALYRSRFNGSFPSYLCSMTEVGELSGRLDDVMEGLAEYYHREDTLAANLRSAVSYPLLMLGMMAVVLIILVIRVLPVFQQVYEQLGVDMSGISGTLLQFGERISAYSIPAAIFLNHPGSYCLLDVFQLLGQKKHIRSLPQAFLFRTFCRKSGLLPICKRNVSFYSAAT